LWGGEVQLVCPRDHSDLFVCGTDLLCVHGHRYCTAAGVPIMLTDAPPTHWGCTRGIDPSEINNDLSSDSEITRQGSRIDPYVNAALIGSSGNLYKSLVGKLSRYPIPALRLPDGENRVLVDLGCHWGRWSIAAARKGYRVIGVDPNLRSVLAARRVARQMGIAIEFLVADARHLPLKRASVDCVFSYSVLQHFPPEDAWAALDEVGRILRLGGVSVVQMANVIGVRMLYNQIRRCFRYPGFFDVHLYLPWELQREFHSRVGPTAMIVDGYFGLGVQPANADLMPPFERSVIIASESLRYLSELVPPLRFVADSLYFKSRRCGRML
jgi:SAM-dependent methyltransferase